MPIDIPDQETTKDPSQCDSNYLAAQCKQELEAPPDIQIIKSFGGQQFYRDGCHGILRFAFNARRASVQYAYPIDTLRLRELVVIQ